jgi:hypothetical protein
MATTDLSDSRTQFSLVRTLTRPFDQENESTTFQWIESPFGIVDDGAQNEGRTIGPPLAELVGGIGGACVGGACDLGASSYACDLGGSSGGCGHG